MYSTRGIQHSSQLVSQPKSILKQSKVQTKTIGYNPNQELESEYIDNLLKQIHFMNLEIKLLKEKQQENQNKRGFTGMLQQDGKYLVDHVIISKDKYAKMKEDLNREIVDNYDSLQDHEHQLYVEDSRRMYFEKEIEDLKTKIKAKFDDYEVKIRMVMENGKKEKQKKEHLENEIIKVERQIKDILKEYDDLTVDNMIKTENDKLDDIEKQEQAQVDNNLLDQEMQIIKDLEEQIEKEQEERRQNEVYQKLYQQYIELKKKKKDTQVNLIENEYKVKELEQCVNFASIQKQKDMDTKTALKQDYDDLLDVQQELIKGNKLKVDRKLLQLDDEDQNQLNKELLQFNREVETQRQKYNSLLKDTKNYLKKNLQRKYGLDKIIHMNNLLFQNTTKYRQKIQEIKPDLLQLRQNVKVNQDMINELYGKNKELHYKVKKLQEQDLDYSSSVDFLRRHIHMDDDLKQINLEDLKQLIEKNEKVNSTISGFVDKWQEMNKFSKQL